MSLQFILGNSGSGKSHLLYETITRESIRDPQKNYLVIVPEQFTMQTQRDLVLMHPYGGIMNIDVLSFQRLAYRVFEEVGEDERIVLTETGKNLMLRRVAQQQKDHLQVLGAQINRIGCVSRIKSVLSELMQYEITDDDLNEMILSAKDRPLLKAKLEDIRVLYAAFLKCRNDRFVKPEELMDLLSDAAKHSALLKNSVLAFDGFAGFTPSQLRVFAELLRVCPRVYLTVTIDAREDFFRKRGDHELFAPAGRLIKSAADAALKDMEEPIVLGKETLPRFSKGGALEHLEQNLFRKNARAYTGNSDEISLHALSSPLQEVHFVARTIAHLVLEEGIRYRDIAVIAGDLSVYGSYVRRIFPLYDIPVFLDETHQVLLNPCLEFVRGALALVQDDFSRASVFRFLRTGMAGLNPQETDLLENHVIAAGIRGRRLWEKPWEHPTRRELPEDVAQLEALRLRFMERIGAFADAMSEKDRTLTDYARALVQLMEDCAVQKQLRETEEVFRTAGRKEEAAEYAQIYAIVIGVLEEMVDLLGEERMDCREFSEILDAALQEAKIGLIPPCIDQVQVGDIRRSRLSNIEVLFFVGLNDGWVPASADEGGILSDTEREILLEHGAALAPSARENSYIQRYYLYQNLTKPKRKLILSWCILGADASSMRPSYLVSVLQNLFPKIDIVKESDAGTHLTQVTSKKNGMLCLLHGLQLIREPEGSNPDHSTDEDWASWQELYRFYLNDEVYRDRVRELTKAAYADVIDQLGKLDPATARALYLSAAPKEGSAQMMESVTRLEKFAGCPFSYFAAFGLRLQEREEYGLRPMDLGNIFHEAMELFSKEMLREGINWGSLPYEKEAARMDACVEQAAESYAGGVLEDSARQAYTVCRMKRILRRTLQVLRVQMAAGAFRVSDVELAFSDGKNPAAFRVEAPDDTEIFLQGRIDRIDTVETEDAVYVKVVDYKSGMEQFDLSSMYYGQQLQLMVYLDAALSIKRREYPDKKIIPAGALYVRMQDPVLEMFKEPKEAFDALFQKMRPDGLVNRDEPVPRLFDRDTKGESQVIHAAFNQDGTLKGNKSLVTSEEFAAISSYVSGLLKDMTEAILDGTIAASPFEDACKYCIYSDVCGRDKKNPAQSTTRTSRINAAGARLKIMDEFKGGDGTCR